VTVIDELECAGEHEAEIFWHFAEQCEVEAAENRLSISREDVKLLMTMPLQARCEIYRGSENPILGWNSRRFDERVASPSARATLKINGVVRLATHMTLMFNGAASQDPKSERQGSGAARRVVASTAEPASVLERQWRGQA
jgi:hypothetical protein